MAGKLPERKGPIWTSHRGNERTLCNEKLFIIILAWGKVGSLSSYDINGLLYLLRMRNWVQWHEDYQYPEKNCPSVTSSTRNTKDNEDLSPLPHTSFWLVLMTLHNTVACLFCSNSYPVWVTGRSKINLRAPWAKLISPHLPI